MVLYHIFMVKTNKYRNFSVRLTKEQYKQLLSLLEAYKGETLSERFRAFLNSYVTRQETYTRESVLESQNKPESSSNESFDEKFRKWERKVAVLSAQLRKLGIPV
jgi:hypothetical protein